MLNILFVLPLLCSANFFRLADWECDGLAYRWEQRSTASYNFSSSWTDTSLGFTTLGGDTSLICTALVPNALLVDQNVVVSLQFVLQGPIMPLTKVRVALYTETATFEFSELCLFKAGAGSTLVQRQSRCGLEKQLSATPTTFTAMLDAPGSPATGRSEDDNSIRVSIEGAPANMTIAFGNAIFATNCSHFESDPGEGTCSCSGCSCFEC